MIDREFFVSRAESVKTSVKLYAGSVPNKQGTGLKKLYHSFSLPVACRNETECLDILANTVLANSVVRVSLARTDGDCSVQFILRPTYSGRTLAAALSEAWDIAIPSAAAKGGKKKKKGEEVATEGEPVPASV